MIIEYLKLQVGITYLNKVSWAYLDWLALWLSLDLLDLTKVDPSAVAALMLCWGAIIYRPLSILICYRAVQSAHFRVGNDNLVGLLSSDSYRNLFVAVCN